MVTHKQKLSLLRNWLFDFADGNMKVDNNSRARALMFAYELDKYVGKQ